ncbi:hypothetical protein GDO81_000951 [Engystomops pustulosus]|uniref:UBX domain-containing protein n=1 Tax=Engystomops pustulosus TaxID=76066 RepID=A0AAV7DAY1_ENGPU|nr:hypothetical protein GDO81_000951 [Engystomops pustulosus]
MAARGRAPVLCLLLVSFFILLYLRSHPLVPQKDNERHQEMVRKEQQELFSKEVSEYSENVLKPRQEEKLKKLEERFYRMTGQTWKLTEGHALGPGTEDQQDDSTGVNNCVETANEEAIRKRKLPECVTKPLPQCEQPQPKRVIVLPDEPSESEEDVVTIALRCPSGRVYRRRFYKSFNSLVLLDWMMKIGYHSVFYTICTPIPRCPLELKENATLENIGITGHTVLNIEEKDTL